MKVDGGLLQVSMAEKHLDGTEIGTTFQQMCSPAMAQGLFILLMIRIQQRSAIASIRSMA
jgi:hypothetical protein